MKKKKAACQGRPNLNCNNDEYSEPSNDRQQETAPTALAPCAIMFFPGVFTLTREDARNILKNRPAGACSVSSFAPAHRVRERLCRHVHGGLPGPT